ncbi:hypothetical protein [Intrasporangium sp. YIM S08009]|uniref:hypothetical protein n=1 Tax=Intrasporangium zincisolvens TaxID=3080018 RepID=UPI002B05C127|nr:hypothetical protein [Intrasporangium sp. YIM S08009]
MRPLTRTDPVGALVLYTGRADPVLVTRPDAVDAGRVLGEHHPGTVTDVDPVDGVCVSFLGLEDEDVCRARFAPDADGHVPGLVHVSGAEWEAARTTGWWSSLAG